MHIDIFGIKYKINEESSNDLFYKKDFFAFINYEQKEIFINKDTHLAQKKQNLIHELTHAYLFETQLDIVKKEYSEEEMCEFVSKFSEKILKHINDYFLFMGYTYEPQ